MRPRILIYMIAALFLFSGCGYSTRSLIKSRFKTVYVEPVKNKVDITQEAANQRLFRTYHPLLDRDITNAIIERYAFEGGLRLAQPQDADIILKAELTDYRRDALRYDDNDDVLEYRLTLILNMALRDNKKDEEVWSETSFSGDTTYFVTGPQAKSESSAVDAAIKDLAKRVVERTIEDW